MLCYYLEIKQSLDRLINFRCKLSSTLLLAKKGPIQRKLFNRFSNCCREQFGARVVNVPLTRGAQLNSKGGPKKIFGTCLRAKIYMFLLIKGFFMKETR